MQKISKWTLIALIVTTLSGCTRSLSNNETAYLTSFIGPNLNYDEIKIRRGNLPSLLPKTGAITVRDTIHWQSKTYRENFIPSPPNVSFSQDRYLLAHEIVHIWQRQNAKLTGYTIGKVAREHRVYKREVYKYPKPLDPKRKFLSYRYEQQAQIVQDWVALKERNELQAIVYENVIREVLPATFLAATINSASR